MLKRASLQPSVSALTGGVCQPVMPSVFLRFLWLHAQGNRWACPGGDSIDVCNSLDEVQLGELKCEDEAGLAGSATSRYAVIDLLRVMPTSEDCPEQELVSRKAQIRLLAADSAHDPEMSGWSAWEVHNGSCSRKSWLKITLWMQAEGVADFKVSENGQLLPGGVAQ